MWEHMCDSFATAIRAAIGQDTSGGTTQDFTTGDAGVTTLWSNRPCSYQESGVGIKLVYGQRDIYAGPTVYFFQDPGDLANCVLNVTRALTGDTISLIIAGVQDPIQLGAVWVWPVICERQRLPA